MDAAPTPQIKPIGDEIGGVGKSYFDQVVTDNLIDAVIELAAELWTVKDRQFVLEQVLADHGIDASAQVEAWRPGAAAKATRKAAREAFITQVFASFSRRTRSEDK